MFYRMKFDNTIGCILNDAGYRSNSQKFAVWPAGLSASLISDGKRQGLDAKTAAYMGLGGFFASANVSESEKKSIIGSALMHARSDSDIGHDVVSFLEGLLN